MWSPLAQCSQPLAIPCTPGLFLVLLDYSLHAEDTCKVSGIWNGEYSIANLNHRCSKRNSRVRRSIDVILYVDYIIERIVSIILYSILYIYMHIIL